MQFQAKVITAANVVEMRELDAAHEGEAKRLVEASGARLLSLRKASALQGGGATRSFNLTVFNQQLHSLLEAGQPVVDAIEILGANDVKGKHRSIYDALLQALREGKQLSEAMASLPSVFPALYVAMVRSSETTGTVRASVSRFMVYQRQVDEIRGKLVSAAIYPAVLLSVAFVVVGFLMLYVVPRFSVVFDDAGPGGASGGFVQVWGTFVRNHALLAWASVLGLAAAVAALVLHRGLRARAFERLLAIPWVGHKVRMLQLARLYRTLGMLLTSGVSILSAMTMTRAALPLNLHADLKRAAVNVSEGWPLSTALAACGLSTEVAQRLLVAGESSGNLDEMLGRIADFYDQELAIWIDTGGRLIEPIMMIAIGLIIGAVVLMLYMPIFDLTSVVS